LVLLGRGYAQTAETPPQAGSPTFVVPEIVAGKPLRIVAYGDMRFTDPSNQADTNPKVRKWLVGRIAQEKPDVLLLSGDLPYRGSKQEDWNVYREETAPWRQAGLRVYSTLGNHEFYPDGTLGLQNYFANFPELKGNRWYSVRLGSVYLIALDSVGSSAAGSPQREWLAAQLANLPPEVDFVFFLSHMPMMADVQSEILVHLPSPEQSELRDFLEAQGQKSHAKFVVVNGHIHNYERFEHGGITYLVSGGGGAKPYPVWFRGERDLYQAPGFPNFHYLVITVEGKHASATMYRVADPEAERLSIEAKDFFKLDAK
jgi:acid phosphatase type 7